MNQVLVSPIIVPSKYERFFSSSVSGEFVKKNLSWANYFLNKNDLKNARDLLIKCGELVSSINACNYKNNIKLRKDGIDPVIRLGKDIFYQIILQIESIDEKLKILENNEKEMMETPNTPTTPEIESLKERLEKIMKLELDQPENFTIKKQERLEEALEKLYIYLKDLPNTHKYFKYIFSALETLKEVNYEELKGLEKYQQKILFIIFEKSLKCQENSKDIMNDIKLLIENFQNFFKLSDFQLRLSSLIFMSGKFEHTIVYFRSLELLLKELEKDVKKVQESKEFGQINSLLIGHFRMRILELKFCFEAYPFMSLGPNTDALKLMLKCIKIWLEIFNQEDCDKMIKAWLEEGIKKHYLLNMEKILFDMKESNIYDEVQLKSLIMVNLIDVSIEQVSSLSHSFQDTFDE